jgi:hypothetical protein
MKVQIILLECMQWLQWSPTFGRSSLWKFGLARYVGLGHAYQVINPKTKYLCASENWLVWVWCLTFFVLDSQLLKCEPDGWKFSLERTKRRAHRRSASSVRGSSAVEREQVPRWITDEDARDGGSAGEEVANGAHSVQGRLSSMTRAVAELHGARPRLLATSLRAGSEWEWDRRPSGPGEGGAAAPWAIRSRAGGKVTPWTNRCRAGERATPWTSRSRTGERAPP